MKYRHIAKKILQSMKMATHVWTLPLIDLALISIDISHFESSRVVPVHEK